MDINLSSGYLEITHWKRRIFRLSRFSIFKRSDDGSFPERYIVPELTQ